MIKGDVFIEEGALLIIHGFTIGSISNKGRCDIFGTADGKLNQIETGIFNIDVNASIQ